jgi:DNA repair photolyase
MKVRRVNSFTKKRKTMALNEAKGNMYEFVTHTWNTVKGQCPHGCTYCYMKRWGPQKPVRFDPKELNTDLGHNNFIFVGSSCDMFARDIPSDWIRATLKHCEAFDNRYLFQTKYPQRVRNFLDSPIFDYNSVLCTTIETNRWYGEIMKESPQPIERGRAMNNLSQVIPTYVTIEPIMDFDLPQLSGLIRMCRPQQVNIGADTGNNHLPEPPRAKVHALISELSQFTRVEIKSNLKRITGP